MLAPNKPNNETLRLQALRHLLILDTPRKQRFDKIVNYAAMRFDMPIVAMMLVGEDDVRCKAIYGLPASTAASRRHSLWGHAILESEIMVVEDVAADQRFHDGPLVTGFPFLRFYAGAQLNLPSGLCMGTLCLMDKKPRKLSRIDLTELAVLRDIMVTELLQPDSTRGRIEYLASSGPDILGFINTLEKRGLPEALLYLNARMPHRYTGVYRYDGDVLRNIYLVDKYDSSVVKSKDAPVSETYCGALSTTNSIQFFSHVPDDIRISNSAVRAYCGVLIQDGDGKPFGSLCHFDMKSCETRISDLPLLEYVAHLVYRALV